MRRHVLGPIYGPELDILSCSHVSTIFHSHSNRPTSLAFSSQVPPRIIRFLFLLCLVIAVIIHSTDSAQATTRRRLRRPTGSPIVRTATSKSAPVNLVADKKTAQDRSDQVVSPSASRFRVRNKHRKTAAAAAIGAGAVGAGAATALATNKNEIQDKDGYKVRDFGASTVTCPGHCNY